MRLLKSLVKVFSSIELLILQLKLFVFLCAIVALYTLMAGMYSLAFTSFIFVLIFIILIILLIPEDSKIDNANKKEGT